MKPPKLMPTHWVKILNLLVIFPHIKNIPCINNL